MPRRRTIDDEPIRYCGNPDCSKVISKRKPGGKWKTPTQYQDQKGCCVACSKIIKVANQRKARKVIRTGWVEVELSAVDLFLSSKRKR